MRSSQIFGKGSAAPEIRTFAVSGTYTTLVAGRYRLRAQGSGGSGAFTQTGAATGGNGGAFCESVVTLPAGVTLTVNIGAAGARQSTLNTNGNAGGATSISGPGITTMTANGGAGGVYGPTSAVPAAAAIATGGNVRNASGGRGGACNAALQFTGGGAAGSYFGDGGDGGANGRGTGGGGVGGGTGASGNDAGGGSPYGAAVGNVAAPNWADLAAGASVAGYSLDLTTVVAAPGVSGITPLYNGTALVRLHGLDPLYPLLGGGGGGHPSAPMHGADGGGGGGASSSTGAKGGTCGGGGGGGSNYGGDGGLGAGGGAGYATYSGKGGKGFAIIERIG